MRGLKRRGFVAGLIIIALTGTLTLPSAIVAVAQKQKPAKTTSKKPFGTYKKSLGNIGVNFPGTGGQCRTILAMMQKRPGKALYVIEYTDFENTKTTFIVDIKSRIIIRNRFTPTGYLKGTHKYIWRGDIMKRLKDGANPNSNNLGVDYEERRS